VLLGNLKYLCIDLCVTLGLIRSMARIKYAKIMTLLDDLSLVSIIEDNAGSTNSLGYLYKCYITCCVPVSQAILKIKALDKS